MFIENLKIAALEKCGLGFDRPLLVGVSGGADSLALMLGLKLLGFQLKIAHLDHSLREESDQDAAFLEILASSLGLEFVSNRVNVGQVAEVDKQSIEEAARQVRYRFLFDQAQVCDAQAVLVGHNADDQVETVLMHILRGSALPGLTGMSYRKVLPIWSNTIPLVRPLLGIWREDIEAFLAEKGIAPRIDHTNQDLTYFRNKLRHVLIPGLMEYNPRIKETLWRMADVLNAEDQLLEGLTQKAWDDCRARQEREKISLFHSKFMAQPLAIQRRLLRFVISLLRPDLRDIDYDSIERGLEFSRNPTQSGQIDLISRLNIAKLEDYLIIKTWKSKLPDWQLPLLKDHNIDLVLDIGQGVSLRHGWRLEAELLDSLQTEKFENVEDGILNDAWLDYDMLKMPLIVRGRREGDRWQPLGMQNHTQKLKDFFINEKIPEHLRDAWPLVVSGDQIAWVVRLRPSEQFKISEKSDRLLHLYLRRKVV